MRILLIALLAAISYAQTDGDTGVSFRPDGQTVRCSLVTDAGDCYGFGANQDPAEMKHICVWNPHYRVCETIEQPEYKLEMFESPQARQMCQTKAQNECNGRVLEGQTQEALICAWMPQNPSRGYSTGQCMPMMAKELSLEFPEQPEPAEPEEIKEPEEPVEPEEPAEPAEEPEPAEQKEPAEGPEPVEQKEPAESVEPKEPAEMGAESAEGPEPVEQNEPAEFPEPIETAESELSPSSIQGKKNYNFNRESVFCHFITSEAQCQRNSNICSWFESNSFTGCAGNHFIATSQLQKPHETQTKRKNYLAPVLLFLLGALAPVIGYKCIYRRKPQALPSHVPLADHI